MPGTVRSPRLAWLSTAFAVLCLGREGTSIVSPSLPTLWRFLDHCKGLGVSAMQVEIGARDDAYADDLRARAEAASMALEGVISLPRDDADVARFEAEVRTAKPRRGDGQCGQ